MKRRVSNVCCHYIKNQWEMSICKHKERDTYEVPSLPEFQDRIRNISSILPYIKAVEAGEILGYAYAGKFKSRKAYDWSVEVTVYVRKD